MATKRELERMSVDDLDNLSVDLKKQMSNIRDERLLIRQIRDEKVEAERLHEAIVAAGLEGKVVVPNVATMNAEGQ